MTASLAALSAERFGRTPRLTPVSRHTALLVLVAIVAGVAAVVAAPLSQAAILLAAPAAALWLISRAAADGLDHELDAETLRIVLGLPRPMD